MTDVLAKVGLFVDQRNELRLLEPSVQQKCVQLRELSDQFMASEYAIAFVYVCCCARDCWPGALCRALPANSNCRFPFG